MKPTFCTLILVVIFSFASHAQPVTNTNAVTSLSTNAVPLDATGIALNALANRILAMEKRNSSADQKDIDMQKHLERVETQFLVTVTIGALGLICACFIAARKTAAAKKLPLL